MVTCSRNASLDATAPLRFTVLNTGQSLAQIAQTGACAVAFDMGDSAGFDGWLDGYGQLGTPRLIAIVISHTDGDHLDGLSMLPLSAGFTGLIITHRGEDTALIRARGGVWRDRLYFRFINQGDTMKLLDGVDMECLWPRECDVDTGLDNWKNRFSLCFMLHKGYCAVLVTSDIDTIAERGIALRSGPALASDFMVAPHHGSRYSCDPVFFGYVNPRAAAIACAKVNPFGHPSQEMLDLFYQMQTAVYPTFSSGAVCAVTNGEYVDVRGIGDVAAE